MQSEKEVEIVNVVGSGSLGAELDLKQVTRDIGSVGEYDPEKYPGMYIRFDEEAPLITLYRTGKYIITGASSEEGSRSIRTRFLDLLADNGMIERPNDDWFAIQNLVCTGELDQSLNLSAIAIGLGLEVTEYEPEQFPGLIYRPQNSSCVVLLFATGRIVITGSTDIEEVETVFVQIQEQLSDLQGTV